MTSESSSEESNQTYLLELVQDIQMGLIRKPEHFNVLHFLLFLLYDCSGYSRDNYPLWRWYYRIKKKSLLTKHYSIDNEKTRQCVLSNLQSLIENNPSVTTWIKESVQVEEHYLHSPIHSLFQFYTPLHTYLYLEQPDKPVVHSQSELFQFFRTAFLNLYQNDSSDLIHFAIAHRKTKLLEEIFGDENSWFKSSMSLSTERGWLPLHYAAYIGDKEIVKTICDTLTSTQFDSMGLFISNVKRTQFESNPHEYILQACGVEQETTAKTTTTNNSPHRSSKVDGVTFTDHCLAVKRRSIGDVRDQPSLTINTINSNSSTNNNETDIPDADELELSSLPLIQREELIDKILHLYTDQHRFIPSPLILACLATCGEKMEYEEIVQILLESRLLEFDGLNHQAILNDVLDYMARKDFARFQYVEVYRDTDLEGPSTFLFYQFDGFIVNQDVKPLTAGARSGSSVTLNTSKNDESDEDQTSDTPISVRCFFTILVLRNIFFEYPRWDFHLLRETIEEHFVELENALGCRPTILYPDGEIISSRKRSDLTWELFVKYRLSSETGQSIYMQVDYYFFESFGDPLADAFANVYQTPFYIACMTDSTVMMEAIFNSFFKRRHLNCWGIVAQKHIEHCFDGILQTKNNCTTFLSLCSILSRFYQVEGDPLMEENSAIIQRMFVHAFACCVRRNAKIELDYLIKNHALIYYESCRTKASDIRHNILTYCVVRNLATIFDQLMSNMKTQMYKSYQNSTNPDWQPHVAWKEIIHVIIDPVVTPSDHHDFLQLASYGDQSTNYALNGSLAILQTSDDEYVRCNNLRKNSILRAKRKLPRALSDTKKQRPNLRRINSVGHRPMKQTPSQSSEIEEDCFSEPMTQRTQTEGQTFHLTKKSRNILKNVNPLRWGGKYERQHSIDASCLKKRINPVDEVPVSLDAISLKSIDDDEIDPLANSLETSSEKLQPHRTKTFQQLRTMFWPRRERKKTSFETDEHEQIPMIEEQRKSS